MKGDIAPVKVVTKFGFTRKNFSKGERIVDLNPIIFRLTGREMQSAQQQKKNLEILRCVIDSEDGFISPSPNFPY